MKKHYAIQVNGSRGTSCIKLSEPLSPGGLVHLRGYSEMLTAYSVIYEEQGTELLSGTSKGVHREA